VRNASTRFANLAQLCSYQDIANARLDIQDHQRLSKKTFDLLLNGFEEAKRQSSEQDSLLSRLGDRFIDETEVTQQLIRIMAMRVVELEATFRNFAESSTSIHPALVQSESS
jgi:hypothetical protein